ncbi:MAG: rRNA maturation RNase YbeY [Eubacteriales bacterium]
MIMRSEHDIFIKNDQNRVYFSFKLRNIIRAAITAALAHEGYVGRAEVSVTITDDEEIHILNNEYRGVDRATDVLSFPLDEADELGKGGENDVLGDIVISLERAQAQAQEYGHSLEREVAFLTVHSVLHLLGYDHMSEAEETEMFDRQREILDEMRIRR